MNTSFHCFLALSAERKFSHNSAALIFDRFAIGPFFGSHAFLNGHFKRFLSRRRRSQEGDFCEGPPSRWRGREAHDGERVVGHYLFLEEGRQVHFPKRAVLPRKGIPPALAPARVFPCLQLVGS
jgi:hypothetical protein